MQALGFPRPSALSPRSSVSKIRILKKYSNVIFEVIMSSYKSSQTMFSKHVKKKTRLVIKLTELKNIKLEKNLEAVNQLRMNSFTGNFHW